MNIGIDARLLDGNITGISRYLRNLIKYLPLFDNANKYFLYTFDWKKKEDEFYTVIPTRKRTLPKQIYSHYWLNFILPKYLAEQNIDIFFTPYILVPLKKGSYKNIIVIHDSMPKACKQYYTFYYRKYLELVIPPAIRRSDVIVTVSESARQDLIKYNAVDPQKIHYMHLWADERFKPRIISRSETEAILSKYNLPENYILYVGAIEERKNILGILKISDILVSRGVDIKIVLIGSKGFGFNKIYKEILKRKDRVIYLNYVEEQNLPSLYNLAKIFLFPSHYEGFGLPPLEAMQSGIPVVASKTSSLQEVIGDSGLLSDAEDYNSLAKDIISLVTNDELYSTMKVKAINQAKNFTPETQLPKLIDIFRGLSA